MNFLYKESKFKIFFLLSFFGVGGGGGELAKVTFF